MAPATRKYCDYPGCDRGPESGPYVTDEGIATRADVMADLNNHVRMAHELPLKLQESKAEATRAEAERLRAEAEKLWAEQGSTQTEGSGEGSRVPGQYWIKEPRYLGRRSMKA